MTTLTSCCSRAEIGHPIETSAPKYTLTSRPRRLSPRVSLQTKTLLREQKSSWSWRTYAAKNEPGSERSLDRSLDSLDNIFQEPSSSVVDEREVVSVSESSEVTVDIPSPGGEDELPISTVYRRCLGASSKIWAVELELPMGFVMEEDAQGAQHRFL